jgi:acetyl esterase/lipase
MLVNGPSVKPQETGTTKFIKIPNRSDQAITAVITIPREKPSGKLPLLVWIRDGIWKDLDRPEWHPIANYFAAEGFVVARVNYTGSEGLLGGLRADKSQKEGVLAFYKDIEDTVKALADANLIDPKKVSIGGEGIAAWASAYAPIASPGTYKAVISMNGLYDLVEYREASEGENEMNAAMILSFANADSELSDAAVQALSVPQNLSNYADSAFVTTGKWSASEYKKHVAEYVKALKKEKVSVRTYSDDWWGKEMDSFQRVEALKRARLVLTKAME